MAKKAEKAQPKKTKKVKQGELPGMEGKHVKEVEDAAELYEEQRDERIALSAKESDALNALVAAMQKHNLTSYKNPAAVPPYVVTLKPGKVKAKVERLKDGGAEA